MTSYLVSGLAFIENGHAYSVHKKNSSAKQIATFSCEQNWLCGPELSKVGSRVESM